MHCLFLFRDAAGRLPTAQELRRCGFGVSEAVLPATSAPGVEARPTDAPPRPECALAAEQRAAYGGGARAQKSSPDPLGPGEPDFPLWFGA